MKKRIEELKKTPLRELLNLPVCGDVVGREYYGGTMPYPIEVISARMWEKATIEAYNPLREAMYYIYDAKDPIDTLHFFLFGANRGCVCNTEVLPILPRLKLICAIAALEASK